MKRDRAIERYITFKESRGCEPSELSDFAEKRADGGHKYGNADNRPVLSRSPKKETLEELADARNYLVWWIQDHLDGRRITRTEDGQDAELALREMLGAVAHAFAIGENLVLTRPAKKVRRRASR